MGRWGGVRFYLRPVRNTREALLLLSLAPLFVAVHAWARHSGSAGAADAALVWALLAAGAALLAGVLCLLRFRLSVAVAGATIALLLFAFWGYVYDHTRALHLRIPVQAAVLAVPGAGVWWMFGRMPGARQARLLRFGAVLFAALAVVDGGLLLQRHLKARQEFPPLRPPVSSPKSPSFYLLLFDEWASLEALRRDLGYDLSNTEAFLTSRGFYLLPRPRSNYPQTVFSMASMLNAAYLPPRRAGAPVTPEEYDACLRRIRDARLPRAFGDAGYRIINLSVFALGKNAPLVGRPFFPGGVEVLLSSTFWGRVLRHKLPAFRSMDRPAHDPYYDPLYNQDSVLQHLARLPVRGAERRFVYAHFLTPHWPFYFDTAGKLLPVGKAIEATLANKASSYRAALPRAEAVLRQAVQTVMEKERGQAIVLVMGDHGYRNERLPGNDTAAFEALAAVYFPDGNYSALPAGTTHVNVMRVAASRALGVALPPLPDSCVHLGPDAQAAW